MTMNNNYFGYPQPYVYVIKCTTPGKYYVGSTFRQFYKRMDEHKGGHCIWTRRYGFGRVVAKIAAARSSRRGRTRSGCTTPGTCAAPRTSAAGT